jgi:hypothetical protein
MLFALLAVVTFALALFNVHIGSINLVTLGLLFVAVHLAVGGSSILPASFHRRSPA